MRIHLLIYDSLDTMSGGYLYDRKLVEHLTLQGDQVEVISIPNKSYLLNFGDNLSASLHKRLAHLDTDVLVQDELNHPSLFWINQRIGKARKYPIVSIVHHLRCQEHHPLFFKRFYALVEQKYLRGIDGYIFNSLTTQKSVEILVGHRLPAVVAHPAGDHLRPTVDESKIHDRSNHSGPLNLLFLGNISYRKGLHVLLAALERLPSESWQLEIAGRLDLEKRYSRYIQNKLSQLGYKRQVFIHGPLQPKALVKVLEKSHLIVLPSFIEGFGIAYLEGMGFGLPAIASSVGGAKEIITHGHNGFLVAPGDVQAIANYLQLLISDRQRLIIMSLAARQRFLEHPTWDQTSKHIRFFLHRLVESHAQT
jgi:glycosyltransferase involved in cell wall biosynthesis